MLFAAFLVCTSYAAAYVTLFIDDSGRRADAYRVLKLVLRVGTAGGTVVGILIRLYENGQLW